MAVTQLMTLLLSKPLESLGGFAGLLVCSCSFTPNQLTEKAAIVKILTLAEANQYLDPVGMKIGNWNEIVSKSDGYRSVQQAAPKDNLLCFAQHVAGWLPRSAWKMFQIDNSTGWMEPTEASLFGGLIFGAKGMLDINSLRERTFLFEFGNQTAVNDDLELLIANLIYVFLFSGSHGYVVSSNTDKRRLLAVQDGTIYFCSRDEDDLRAGEAVVNAFAQNPLESPKWVVDIAVKRQQQVT